MSTLTEGGITSAMLLSNSSILLLGLVVMPEATQAIQYVCLGVSVLISVLCVTLLFRVQPEVEVRSRATNLKVAAVQKPKYVHTPIDLPPLAGTIDEYKLWH